MLVAAALAMALAALQYLALEAVTASAWVDPSYSYVTGLVPDLGNTGCGPYQDRVVCSPLSSVMNTAFVLQGLLFGAAGVLLATLLARRARVLMTSLAVVHAVGLVLVGIFAQSPEAGISTLVVNITAAGLGILAGNAVLVVAGRRREALSIPSWLGRASVVVGTLTIVAAIALLATDVPPGVRERLSIYPFILWQLVTGVVLLRAVRASRTRLRPGLASTPTA